MGEGEHRSGWPFAIHSLAPLLADTGVLLDDFVERTFTYSAESGMHQEPWIGIFHHPHQMPPFALPRHRPQEMLQLTSWKQSAPYLQLAISLSEYLAEYLRPLLSVPVVVVRHPTATPVARFSMKSFLNNPQPRLIQAGWYLRNTRAIYQVAAPSRITKTLIAHGARWARDYDRRVETYWDAKGNRAREGQVQVIRRVPDAAYDHLLSQNIVFAEYFDVSASNLIVECIARHTPMVVNRHPATIEYFGVGYPLFYDAIQQVPDLLSKESIAAAHEYLAATSNPWLTGESFCERIRGLASELAM